MHKKLTLFVIFICILSVVMYGNSGKTSTPGHYEAKYTTTVPVIDGIGNDTCWDKAEWTPIDQVWIGPAVTATNFSGKFRMLWTRDRLYLCVRIIDDSLRLQSPGITDVCSNIYNYDCMEIFIDENNSRETNYSGTFKAFAYHMDTAHHICYSMGSLGWVRLDDHINYKMRRVDTHTFDYEYEIKVFSDNYTNGGVNTPVALSNGKVLGWSIAYNDNDYGSSRQNMIGSVAIAGNDKNVSYYNASVFGELKLVGGSTATGVSATALPNTNLLVKPMGDNLVVTYTNDRTNDQVNIQLIDCSGRQLQSITAIKSEFSMEKSVAIAGLSRGIYMLKVINEGKSATKKFVVN